MTYLELINKVLDRLRESRIEATQIDSNPFYRLVGTCVNDAKLTVENTGWEWSHLRGYDDVTPSADSNLILIPDSADVELSVNKVHNRDGAYFLEYRPFEWMEQRYINEKNASLTSGEPRYFSTYYNDSNGNAQLRVWPPTDGSQEFRVHRSKNQAELTDDEDVLLVPALPVYTLAAALASRERGEVGGTPTSELFVIAERALGDAVAMDSARFPEENIFYNPRNTSKETLGRR